MGGAEATPRVHARVDVACSALGLDPPPVDLRFRLTRTTDRRGLLIWGYDEDPLEILGWLSNHAAFELVSDPSAGTGSLVADCSQLPAPLGGICDRFDCHVLLLQADGTAKLAIEAARAEIRELTQELEANDVEARVAQVSPAPETRGGLGPLTDRQHVALATAKEEGYYDIPRRIQLKDLADKLSMSPAALSELLRRAEARLIDSYLATGPPGESDEALAKASLGALDRRAQALEELL